MTQRDMFRSLTRTQRACAHQFVAQPSRYDPDYPAAIICDLCDVNYTDYAATELRAQRRTRHGREDDTRRKDDDGFYCELDEDITKRTVLVWTIEPRIVHLLASLGGNAMYVDHWQFGYSVLLPSGTLIASDRRSFVLPTGETLRLTRATRGGRVDGDALIYSPIASALGRMRTRQKAHSRYARS